MATAFATRKPGATAAVVTSMTVNGEPIRYRLDPDTPLLWALRDASNLTGTKYGCDSGDCGSCTVIVDGRAVLSCGVSIAALEGAQVVTIEGLSSARSHPLQEAWAAEQVSQCGAAPRASSWRSRRWCGTVPTRRAMSLRRCPTAAAAGRGREFCARSNARRGQAARRAAKCADFIQHLLIRNGEMSLSQWRIFVGSPRWAN